jgi:hypothetical protein
MMFITFALGLVLTSIARLFVAPAAAAAAGTLPWLKTAGNQVVTASGQRVTLRGANILHSEWVLNMDWERQAIPYLAQNWKGNVLVRGFAAAPVADPAFTWTSFWGRTVTHAEYMSWLDEEQRLAEQNGMYIVFAYRSMEINGEQPTMPDAMAKKALVALAQRYHGKSNVMYALQVEPHNVTWSTLQPVFQDMTDAIRVASAPYQPIIMVPGTNWSRYVDGAITNPVKGENIVYKSHPYNPSADFQAEFLNTYDAQLPVFVGEFGPHGTMSMADVQELLNITRQRNIGWAAWIFDWQGPPVLLADERFTPSEPFGRTIRNEMGTTQAAPLNIYLNSLAPGWGDWSWGSVTRNLANTSPVFAGNASIAVTYTGGWSGFKLGRTTALRIPGYDVLRFRIRGSTGGGPLEVRVGNSQTYVSQALTPSANAWAMVEVPLARLAPAEVTYIWWQNSTASAQPTFYLDEIQLIDK